MANFSIAILAGGMSRRFGSDKSFAKIFGKYFYEICIEKALNCSDDVLLVSKDSSKYPFIDRVRKIDDIVQDIQTPLVGIYTSTVFAEYDEVFVWSVDAPLLKVEVIKGIVERMESVDDACIPNIKGKIHPLIACYRKRISEKLKFFIKDGNLRVLSFLEQIKVNYIDESFFVKIDPDLRSFSNINTFDDLKKLEG